MGDVKMFIQYHKPLDIDNKCLYKIIDNIDCYNFIRLNPKDIQPDNFIKSLSSKISS